MRKLLLLFLTGWLVFSISCDNPTESKSNPYEQHAIDWPSLADSPWPIWHGNPMGNGLSFDKGPTKGKILWSYIPENVTGGSLGVVFDSNKNLYATSKNGHLISLDFDGNLRWNLSLAGDSYYEDDGECVPLVLNKNKIAVGISNLFYIVNDSGIIEKNFTMPVRFLGASIQVDKEGIFYALFEDDKIRSFNLDGQILWELPGYGGYSGAHIPLFLPDGSGIVAPALNSVQKISTEGIIEWQYPCQYGSPISISSNGEIYFFNDVDTSITCLDVSGDLLWKHHFYSDRLTTISAQTIQKNGNIVFSATQFLGLSPEGFELWWAKEFGYFEWIESDLISDHNGNTYGIAHCGSLYAINDQGEYSWILEGPFYSPGSPAIVDCKMFFSDFDQGVIYAVE